MKVVYRERLIRRSSNLKKLKTLFPAAKSHLNKQSCVRHSWTFLWFARTWYPGDCAAWLRLGMRHVHAKLSYSVRDTTKWKDLHKETDF